MSKINIGINLEFVRHNDKSFEWGVAKAGGDGIIDWAKVIEIVRKDCPRDIVLSVECGTIEQAERSIKHLKRLV
jgi:hypothetical protein